MPFSLPGEGRSSANRVNLNELNSENLLIEKRNLLSVFKLVIKDLLDTTLKHERIIENETFPLRHFFIVLEQILYHGYIGKKSFPLNSSSNRRDLWPLMDLISRKSIDNITAEIAVSIKEMNYIRTSLGRVRAWLRLALMQKRLADYFRILCEQKQELKELYDHQAMLLSDDNVFIIGLLVGLNVLDFNFYFKDMILDYPIDSIIHYSIYLRDRPFIGQGDSIDDSEENVSMETPKINLSNDQTNSLVNTSDGMSMNSSHDQHVSNILDQKNYLEELNRHLQKTMKTLKERISSLEHTNNNLIEEANIQRNRIEKLGGELTKVTAEKEHIQSGYQRKIETLYADMEAERETYRNSRLGFDTMYNDLQKKYDEERASKQKIEDVHQSQLSQNNQYLLAMKRLEDDIESKRTLYELAKEENRHLIEQIEVESARFEERERRIEELERENQSLQEKINKFQTNIDRLNGQLRAFGDANDVLTRALAKSEAEKGSLETDNRTEKEFHQRLQTALNNEKERVSQLHFEIHELTLIKQEYEKYQLNMSKKLMDYETKFDEQEHAIEELAMKLETALREKDERNLLARTKDFKVKECGQCKKEFGTLQRKYQCQKCHQTCCESCVSTKMPLSGSSKPVRVCDTCRNHILAQCAVNTP